MANNIITVYDTRGKVIDNIASFKDNFVMIACSVNCDIRINSDNNSSLITNDNNILNETKYHHGSVVTVYIDEVCDLSIGGLDYRFHYKNTNIIPEHYETLISNKNLPNHDEIYNCIVDRDKYMILGKLILDYRDILKHKGKKLAITKFLTFIGFENIKLFEEYKDSVTNKLALIKTYNSVKTGNYHLIYEFDSYDADNGYTPKNLPLLVRDDNVDNFIDIFWNAIDVAKKYFMVPEQDISFFGITFQTNIGSFISNTSNVMATHGVNPSAYLNDKTTFNIDLFIQNPLTREYIINDALKIDNAISNRAVTFELFTPSDIANDIFFVKPEISDPIIPENLITKFGTLLDLHIIAPEKYIEYTIKHKTIPTLTLSNGVYREYVGYIHTKKLYLHIPGDYELTIDSYNEHNNRERFTYTFTVNEISDKLNVEYFNSAEVIENGDFDDSINLDIESTMLVPSDTLIKSPIHSDTTIATVMMNNIVEYFNTGGGIRFTNIYERYVEKPADAKYRMDDFTVMPMQYLDNYLSLSAYEVLDNYDTALITTHLNDNGFDDKHIWVFMDIADETNKFMLVMNKKTGYSNIEVPAHDKLQLFSNADIPVNYDFNIPDANNHEYKSLYPRLTSNNSVLKLNDIFYARIDLATIVGFKNIKWKVYNSITKELLYEHDGYSLKYRVTNKYIFDVEFIFEINGVTNSIYKEKCFTSFSVEI